MATKIILFCEGTNSSIDRKILLKICPPDGERTVVPLGGKYGSPAFIDGYRSKGNVLSAEAEAVIQPKFICLRDRDFDFAIQPDHIPRLLERPDRVNGARDI